MADPKHWEPEEFKAEQIFRAVKNLQTMGIFEISKEKLKIPGLGDRFFEHYQEILVRRIGPETIDRALHILGQCIKFLATDDSMVNVTGKEIGVI